VADIAYIGKALLKGRPANVEVLGPLVLGYRLALSKNRGGVGIRGAKSWFFAGNGLCVQGKSGLSNGLLTRGLELLACCGNGGRECVAWHASLRNALLGIRRRAHADPTHGNVFASVARRRALISALLWVAGADAYEECLSDLRKTLDGNRFGIPFTP
jgi:hypothetical protein